MTIKFGVIGGGVMGEALLSRLINLGIYQGSDVLVSDPLASRRSFLAEKYGVGVTGENREVASAAEVLFLAIKPQVFEAVAIDLSDVPASSLIISILAGVPLSKLEKAFPVQPVIRTMPNTPATVGAGISAIAAGKKVTPEHLEQAKRIFQAVGEVVEVPESMLDAVTGLSGSGPAYVAILIEALSDGGVAAGLPRAIASQLALQTVFGTAQLLKESGMHPAELKDRVTSPGGTTIAGVAELEKAGLRSAIIEAVKAAYRRSKELGS
ncbi:pyrroline-5-carboxylate reductase [[Phormidium ambiguum] IAM M-71]|uniref:Pyrroline-5-carboxylate reductase n=1 Tax=[Phormidium ambiguum] IAM M-71 TaxID=454136 RepID=A0A1U7IN03_9CYAN|nr:pyrroline-5-carboxylate reductase [Phormidium ambiguum]OKH38728.1 pyrroline-5-carboxylate reductase [Phormidium ambiguum IAM M-71]